MLLITVSNIFFKFKQSRKYKIANFVYGKLDCPQGFRVPGSTIIQACIPITFTRMHSSRMCTTRSLTVSCSIPGGLPNAPWMQTPWMQAPLVMWPVMHVGKPTPLCGQTDICENITLLQTSFAGGKNTRVLLGRQLRFARWRCFILFLVTRKIAFSQDPEFLDWHRHFLRVLKKAQFWKRKKMLPSSPRATKQNARLTVVVNAALEHRTRLNIFFTGRNEVGPR